MGCQLFKASLIHEIFGNVAVDIFIEQLLKKWDQQDIYNEISHGLRGVKCLEYQRMFAYVCCFPRKNHPHFVECVWPIRWGQDHLRNWWIVLGVILPTRWFAVQRHVIAARVLPWAKRFLGCQRAPPVRTCSWSLLQLVIGHGSGILFTSGCLFFCFSRLGFEGLLDGITSDRDFGTVHRLSTWLVRLVWAPSLMLAIRSLWTSISGTSLALRPKVSSMRLGVLGVSPPSSNAFDSPCVALQVPSEEATMDAFKAGVQPQRDCIWIVSFHGEDLPLVILERNIYVFVFIYLNLI